MPTLLLSSVSENSGSDVAVELPMMKKYVSIYALNGLASCWLKQHFSPILDTESLDGSTEVSSVTFYGGKKWQKIKIISCES